MKNVVFSSILALSLCALSCTKTNDGILGTWVLDRYENDAGVYFASKEFDENKSGYIFRADGTLTVRQNAGDCGTPPITYGNFSGTWQKGQNDTILIELEYWGAININRYKMFILSSDNEQMRATFVY